MAQVRQEVTTKQLPMMFMKSTKKYIQMWVFLVAQLQNDTSTEYCILKSVLQVLSAVWPVPMFQCIENGFD